MTPTPPPDAPRQLRFEQLWVGGEWHEDTAVRFRGDGSVAPFHRAAAASGGQAVSGWALPGLCNLHSHAFQRALVGLAEKGGQDSFWNWRDVMYRFLGALTPADVEAVAAQLFVELLKGGFTCVGEFHYLHRQPSGAPYEDPAEMSRRIISAALSTGIRLVHIPVVYQYGGFDRSPLEGGQLRFAMDPDGLAALVEALGPDATAPLVSLGWGVHSLRACPPRTLAEAVAVMEGVAPNGPCPVHIHIAEQEREVEEGIATLGASPIQWLLDNAPVGPDWCLVHATHGTASELERVARQGATVGLCPTTEANLGDGVFPLPAYLDAGGAFGVGTDSHVGTVAAGELKTLEYGQRLMLRRRGVAEADVGTGEALVRRAMSGGAAAIGRPPIGSDAADGDFVVLDPGHPALVGRAEGTVLDAWVFSGSGNPVRDVYVGGRQVIADGSHKKEEEILRRYRQTVERLADVL